MIGFLIGELLSVCVIIIPNKVASKYHKDVVICLGIGMILATILVTVGFFFVTQSVIFYK